MLKVGDRVRVKAKTGGPDIAPILDRFRLRLWGHEGVVTAVVPQLDRPIVVAFADPNVPATVRFWGYDLLTLQSEKETDSASNRGI